MSMLTVLVISCAVAHRLQLTQSGTGTPKNGENGGELKRCTPCCGNDWQMNQCVGVEIYVTFNFFCMYELFYIDLPT